MSIFRAELEIVNEIRVFARASAGSVVAPRAPRRDEHFFQEDGYYRLPFEVTFGTHLYWDSGTPYNITTADTPNAGYSTRFLEPRGSRRLPHFSQWDAQLQKDFPVRVGLIGSVYDILGTEIAISRNGSVGTSEDIAGADNPNFNLNNVYQRPRHYEVGFRLEF